jgi:hypothetical protein
MGIEPTIFWLATRRLTTRLHPHFRAPDRIRTDLVSFTKRALVLTSIGGIGRTGEIRTLSGGFWRPVPLPVGIPSYVDCALPTVLSSS